MLKTKRFAYPILKEYLDRKEEQFSGAYEDGCITILGVRKVGKTVLMQQLCADRPNSSKYIDCSDLSSDFDFEDFYKSCLSSGINRVYLDEICKVNEELKGDFIAYTKLYSSEIQIILTGSTKYVVRSLHAEIGRGLSIELPPITYAERLMWSENESITGSNYEKWVSYLKTNCVVSSSTWKEYINSIVSDTLASYRYRTQLDGVDTLPDDNTFMKVLKYVALCQYVYRLDNGQMVGIPSLTKELQSAVEDYRALRRKYGVSVKDIKLVCQVLLISGLARPVNSLSSEFISNEQSGMVAALHRIDEEVPAIIFEYPWFVNCILTDAFSDSNALVPYWLENAYLLKMSYLYRFSDKFRSANITELDAVYTVGNFHNPVLAGLECKDRDSSKLNRNTISGYLSIKSNLNLYDLVISCSDKNEVRDGYSLYREDIIALALELEYFDRCKREFEGDMSCPVFCESSISELVVKFGLDKI